MIVGGGAGGAGAVFKFTTPRLSPSGPVSSISPMGGDFTFEEFDREILDLALGVAWDGPLGGRYHVAIEEDAIAATGPDFGLLFGVSWGL